MDRLPNFLTLRLSGVDVGDLYLFRGWFTCENCGSNLILIRNWAARFASSTDLRKDFWIRAAKEDVF